MNILLQLFILQDFIAFMQVINTPVINANTVVYPVENLLPIREPILKHIESRQCVVQDGVYTRNVQNISDVISEGQLVSHKQAKAIEKTLITIVKSHLKESTWFWYEIAIRSIEIWDIEQKARTVLGKDISVFMKDTPCNYHLLQQKLTEKGPRYMYLLEHYKKYHAYVMDPLYALNTHCQISAHVPLENGSLQKIMLFCTIQLYPRIFYEDHYEQILWRKGGILIEKMSYNDTDGVWFRTPEGNSNGTKIQLAWYENYV